MKKKLKGKGFFCKMAKRGRDSLRNREKGRGLWEKWPLFPLPLDAEQGRGAWGVGGDPRRRPRALRRPESGGKGRGKLVGLIPLLDFWEGAREEGSHGGGRRVVLAGAVAALQSLVTAGVRGRSTREPRGVDSPAHLG